MPHYIVESIEFDFSDSMGTITEQEQEFITDNALGLWWVDSEWLDPEEEQKFITENALGLWHVEEDDLIDYITDKTGWCISSIKYVPNQPHPLTAYL